MKSFNLGDRVRFLHEVGEGTIVGFQDKEHALVEDEHGFTYPYSVHFLVPVHAHGKDLMEKDKLENDKEKLPQFSGYTKKDKELPVIDLHMENLTDRHHHMSNHEIVLFQMDQFRQFLNRNEYLKNPRMIVIHGLGEGRLKQEIKDCIQGIPGASMHDADYQKFGGGASVIERKYNVR